MRSVLRTKLWSTLIVSGQSTANYLVLSLGAANLHTSLSARVMYITIRYTKPVEDINHCYMKNQQWCVPISQLFPLNTCCFLWKGTGVDFNDTITAKIKDIHHMYYQYVCMTVSTPSMTACWISVALIDSLPSLKFMSKLQKAGTPMISTQTLLSGSWK